MEMLILSIVTLAFFAYLTALTAIVFGEGQIAETTIKVLYEAIKGIIAKLHN